MTEALIVNVVATASVDQELDFYDLSELEWIFYDSDVYGGRVAYLKMPGMQGKITIFQSGKMISIGTRSEERAYLELEMAQEYLVEKGFTKPIKLHPKTQNIVAVANFKRNLDLEKLAMDSNSIYEPEQFPGAILRTGHPFKASILIFASGKAVIAGLTSSQQIEHIVLMLQNLLDRSS